MRIRKRLLNMNTNATYRSLELHLCRFMRGGTHTPTSIHLPPPPAPPPPPSPPLPDQVLLLYCCYVCLLVFWGNVFLMSSSVAFRGPRCGMACLALCSRRQGSHELGVGATNAKEAVSEEGKQCLRPQATVPSPPARQLR